MVAPRFGSQMAMFSRKREIPMWPNRDQPVAFLPNKAVSPRTDWSGLEKGAARPCDQKNLWSKKVWGGIDPCFGVFGGGGGWGGTNHVHVGRSKNVGEPSSNLSRKHHDGL